MMRVTSMERFGRLLSAALVSIALPLASGMPAFALECPSSQPLTRPGVLKETPAQLRSVETLLATGDEDNRVRTIVHDLRARYPGVENAEIMNYLVAAYCPVVSQLTGLGPQEQQARMDHFVGQVVRLVY